MTLTEKVKWSSFSFFLSLCLAFEPVLQLILNESLESALLVYVYIFLVALASLFLITLIGLISTRLYTLAIASFIALSALELKLIYTNTFSDLTSGYLGIFLISFIVVLLLLAYKKVLPSVPNIVFYLAVAVVFVLAPLVTTDKAAFGTEVKLTATENHFLEQFSDITFEQRPNVYLLAFDSMIPPYIAKKYLGIEKLPYERELKKSFIEFEHSASVSVPTKPSLNGVMRLDQRGLTNSRDYFNGMKPSVLSTLFKQNGYEVTTGYASYYFGEKGPYIDRYVIGQFHTLSDTVQCVDVADSLYHKLRAFGVCVNIGEFKNITHLTTKLFGRKTIIKYTGKSWPEKVLEEVRDGANSKAPQLKIFYSYRPNGHVKKNYRHTDLDAQDAYRNYFLDGAEQLDKILEKAASIISINDPSAMLVVFGDHGAWMSRGIKAEEDPEFFYEDRHMVSLSVLQTDNHCANRETLAHYSKPYNTTSRIVASVARCLVNEKESFDRLLDFNEPKPVIKMLMKLDTKRIRGEESIKKQVN